MTPAEENLIRSIPQALAETERVCSSINVGSTKTGLNMDAVRLMGEIVKDTAEATKEDDSLGCASWWYSATRQTITRLWQAPSMA